MSNSRTFFDGPASLGGDGVFNSIGTITPGGIGSSVALLFFITYGWSGSGGGGGGATTALSLLCWDEVKTTVIPFEDGGIGMSLRSPFVGPDDPLASLPSSASTLITFESSLASDDSRISLRTFSLLCFPLTSSANNDVSLMLIDFFGTTLARIEGEGDFDGVLRDGGDGDR